MIQFSTPASLLFIENTPDEPSCSLNSEDEIFFAFIRSELNNEIRQPHQSTIENILAHSRNLSL